MKNQKITPDTLWIQYYENGDAVLCVKYGDNGDMVKVLLEFFQNGKVNLVRYAENDYFETDSNGHLKINS